VTQLKLDSKLGGNAVIPLIPLVTKLYNDLGTHVMVIAELASVERTEPANAEDRKPSVKIAIKAIEVAHGEQDEQLRKAMRALYVHRSATGTIDEHFDMHLAQDVIENLGEVVSLAETARLRAALDLIADNLMRIGLADLTIQRVREQIGNLHRTAKAALEWQPAEAKSAD
jgi:hypothetical protein